MPRAIESAILRTLVYADLFDYPLRKEEIWKWLIRFRIKNHESRIKNKKNIKQHDGYYFLYERKDIISIRKQREKWSREKLKIVEKVASYLKFIPLIRLVGVTGALAINNAKEDDDIDLLIISSSGRLWTTRLLTVLVVELLGLRRRPGEKNVKNKICLNMFVDEGHLPVPQKERDLFSAHEAVQMKPLWDRDNTYKNFLRENLWVKEYLPNSIGTDVKILRYEDIRRKNNNPLNVLFSQFLNILERLLKYLQLLYMSKRRTTEYISDGIIRFHPDDVRLWVLREYYSRLRQYNIN